MTTTERDAEVAARDRGRAVSVRLHRQAQEGQLRREDDRRRFAACCARRCSPTTWPLGPGCSNASSRGSSCSPCSACSSRPHCVRHIPVLVAMYAGTLVLAAASGLSLSFFIKRVWLFIPIFTGIVVLPATFSFITPGDIVVPFGTWFGHPVGMTSQGLTSAGLIVTRVGRLDLARRAVDARPRRGTACWPRCAALRVPRHVHPRAGHGLPLRVPPARLGHRHVHGAEGPHGRRRHATCVGPRVRRRLRRRAVRQVARARRRGAHGHALARATPATSRSHRAVARSAHATSCGPSPAVVAVVVMLGADRALGR